MVRILPNVFIRHVDNEDLVWCPRRDGYLILKDAVPFLEELNGEWRSVDGIVHSIAAKFDCGDDEVAKDVVGFLGELSAYGFLEYDDKRDHEVAKYTPRMTQYNEVLRNKNLNDDSPVSPVGDFFERHRIPAEIHIDLTSACTERCVHCYHPAYPDIHLPYELAEKVLREFRALQGMTVHLTGGECMLHPEFERICRLCKELDLNIIVFTNLTCCNAQRVAFLRNVDPQFLNVSLYSMEARIHDAITKLPGSWRRTMDSILECEKAGVHIRIATPLLKHNRKSFTKLQQFAAEHHMHLVPSIDIVPQSDHDCSNLNHACSPDELREALFEGREIFNLHWDGRIPPCDAKVCDIGVSRIYLNSRGEYYPCDSMHGYALGTASSMSLEEVWHCDSLEYLRGLKNKDFGGCATCRNRPFCKVCPAFNFNATGNLFNATKEKCMVASVVHSVYGDGGCL